ncbi:cupin domain-containing protein [Haloarcula nitratireducens]|uniref:Cupin domain-containing protein n=1 Tax=Haloarcula nitratireducens TaxID=2487749 RepID=A0AAW4PD22_9EURY|nr:cupin domain-containing protein [Halomicroarcula nitratireducens]MBX0295601.1 cupin domain-containing protein [Halomicroarcula nitratireducens]
MERAHLDFDRYFEVVMETDEAQVAEMTVDPGKRVGGPDNYHADSDQWLFAVSGTGVVTVDGEEQRIETGDLLRIEAGERHGIENDGDAPLRTLNVYTPPR